MDKGKRLRSIYYIAGVVLIALLWPTRSLDAPSWDVYVVDESNHPVAKVLVRESYQNYSAELQGHEEDLYTDETGHVHFSPKWISVSFLMRLRAMASSANAGVHASFGPRSYVTAFRGKEVGDDVRDGYLYQWQGSPSQVVSHLILKRN